MTRDFSGTLQTGIQSGAKMARSRAKTAVDAVSAMPHGIANMGTGIFSSPPSFDTETPTSNEVNVFAVYRHEKKEKNKNQLFILFCTQSVLGNFYL